MGAGSHYLDPFLAALKRDAYLELIRRWGGAPESGRVLKTDLFEEAMGPDAFLIDLGRGANTLVGIDVSPAMASQARRRDGPGRACYVAADVRWLPFSRRSFGLVVSPSTLDHFSDPADLGRSLQELARVSGPDGRLIVTLDNRQNLFDPLLHLVVRLGRAPYFVGRSYSRRELCTELESAGMKVEATTAILHNPRLVAVAMVAVANRLGWPPLVAWVRRLLVAAQRLEDTRWRYRTGSFVAAWAVMVNEQEDLPGLGGKG